MPFTIRGSRNVAGPAGLSSSSVISIPSLTPTMTLTTTTASSSSTSAASSSSAPSSPCSRGSKRTRTNSDSNSDNNDSSANKENQNPNTDDEVKSTYRKKKKSKNAHKDMCSIQTDWGLQLGRLFDPYSSPGAMMNMGIKYENAEAEEHDLTQFSAQQLHLVRGYKGAIDHLPAIDALIEAITNQKEPERAQEFLQSLYANLGIGQDSSRSDDNAVLKTQVIKMIQINHSLSEGVADLKENAKDTRGFHNPFIRFLLTGPDIDLSNADVIADMQANRWKSNPEDLLVRFLFANFEIDDDDIYTGFLRSELLVHAYKAVFFGPSSWQGGLTKNRRPCKASLCNLKEVTGRTIAYIATLVHSTLSSDESLHKEGEGSNYSIFFISIVNLFEDDELAEEAKETLDWWQTQIFPTSATSAVAQPAMSAFERLKLQLSADAAAA
ncbi:hypothetical protein M422DRAFT_49104 [Sphaerobolus stellatus SS14]|uniref:Uncharacterized protein n=1 Tax=Sphaerobolus stellatus (strain SS14) TaxID=990650 RepID=A0A0C9UBR6_SPHS4|nr:hypothetical protein M422DRAFT_49104 [Sphaerobolus stellatus SS14]